MAGSIERSAQLVDDVEEVVVRRAPDVAEAGLVHGVVGRHLEGAPRHLAAGVEQRLEVVGDRQPHLQRHRALGAHHGGHVAAQAAHPCGHLVDVADGRGQADQPDVRRRLDDDLLPDGPPRVVVDVVDLVEHDVAHGIEPCRLVVQDVAEDLRGHHHERGTVVDGVLAGDQPDVGGAVPVGEVVELLVGERLQRRRVDDPRMAAAQVAGCEQAAPHRVLGDQRLPTARRRGDEHTAGALQLLDRLALERVERERQRRLEGVDGGGDLVATCGAVRSTRLNHRLGRSLPSVRRRGWTASLRAPELAGEAPVRRSRPRSPATERPAPSPASGVRGGSARSATR